MTLFPRKSILKSLLLSSALNFALSTATLSPAALARESAGGGAGGGGAGEVGNGGSVVLMEFVGLARSIYVDLHSRKIPESLDLQKLADAIEETLVRTVEGPLFLNGEPKVAINYPSRKLIEVSSPQWRSISNLATRRKLVLHEYLGILGLDDSDYALSGRLYPDEPFHSNPCRDAEERLRVDAATLFTRSGAPIHGSELGQASESRTLEGGVLLTLRGFKSPPGKALRAYFVIAQCDPTRGLYRILEHAVSFVSRS